MNDLISALTSGIGNINGSHGGPTGSELSGSNVMVGAATSFLNSQYYNNARPKAFINWILFDKQL